MSRINTNVQSLLAQRVLGQNNNTLNTSLERLSTGLRVNRGADDPAGLIASENLRSELSAANAAIGNAERADQVVNIAEGGLQEISSLLTELQGLLTSSANDAGLSGEEKEANQLQVDSILQTIDRIAGETKFQGRNLLNGSLDFTTSSVGSQVADFQINGAKFDATSLDVDINVTGSAQQAGLYLSFGGTAVNLGGATGSAFTIEIAGVDGNRELSFASGTSLTDVAATINSFSDVTGVEATTSGTGISLNSSDFGGSAFVSVDVVTAANVQGSGIFTFSSTDANTVATSSAQTFASTAAANGIRDDGQDIEAFVNGLKATTDGRSLSVSSDFLDIEFELETANAQTLASFQALSITGGGAEFQLGSSVDLNGKVSLGIQDVQSRQLGRFVDSSSNTRFLDDLGSGSDLNLVDGDLTAAQEVVSNAISQVSSLRGRLGAFQANTIGSTIRNLQVGVENTAAAESQIRDADFAAETANLTRSQILVSAATNSLSLANSQPQNVLQLLG
ncbi:MAG: flagellin [Planctomycetota bacterium]